MVFFGCLLLALLSPGQGRAATATPTPPEGADLVGRAAQARKRGELDSARRLYEQALAASPSDGRAAVGLGETLTDLGEAAAAEKLLVSVAQSLPDRPEPERALARAYLRSDHPKEAAAAAARAVALDAENPDGHILLGLAEIDSGEAARAVPAFERALALRPADPAGLRGLAAAYAALSDPRAVEAYERAIVADRRNLPLAVEFVEYLWRARRYDQGNAEMERVLQKVPGNTKLRMHFGLNLAEQGKFQDAVRQFEAARRDGDSSSDLLVYLGSALWETGRLEEATERLREGVARSPSGSDARHRLGRLLLFRGQPAAAVAQLEAAARLAPDSAQVRLDLGRAYEAAGRTSEAETAYRKALELEPDLAVAHYALGTLLARTGKRGEAAAEIARYREYFEKEQRRRYRNASRQAELNLGWTELESGRVEEALGQFSRHSDDAEGLRGMAEALSRLGRHAEAVEKLEGALRLDPESHALRWELDRERERTKTP